MGSGVSSPRTTGRGRQSRVPKKALVQKIHGGKVCVKFKEDGRICSDLWHGVARQSWCQPIILALAFGHSILSQRRVLRCECLPIRREFNKVLMPNWQFIRLA